MADDDAAWDFEGDDAAAGAATTVEGDGTTEGGEPAPEKVEKVKLDYSQFEKAPKPKYTLHWVRPLFLNYHYLYDYR